MSVAGSSVKEPGKSGFWKRGNTIPGRWEWAGTLVTSQN